MLIIKAVSAALSSSSKSLKAQPRQHAYVWFNCGHGCWRVCLNFLRVISCHWIVATSHRTKVTVFSLYVVFVSYILRYEWVVWCAFACRATGRKTMSWLYQVLHSLVSSNTSPRQLWLFSEAHTIASKRKLAGESRYQVRSQMLKINVTQRLCANDWAPEQFRCCGRTMTFISTTHLKLFRTSWTAPGHMLVGSASLALVPLETNPDIYYKTQIIDQKSMNAHDWVFPECPEKSFLF